MCFISEYRDEIAVWEAAGKDILKFIPSSKFIKGDIFEVVNDVSGKYGPHYVQFGVEVVFKNSTENDLPEFFKDHEDNTLDLFWCEVWPIKDGDECY